jgi:hypothetical protein
MTLRRWSLLESHALVLVCWHGLTQIRHMKAVNRQMREARHADVLTAVQFTGIAPRCCGRIWPTLTVKFAWLVVGSGIEMRLQRWPLDDEEPVPSAICPVAWLR